ncbi:MAG: hypothetical protein ACFFDM_05670 [Candidatus Thorarchaeota archaeon]
MYKRRVEILAFLTLICFVLPLLSSGQQTIFIVSQGGGWSDNFNDANIDGWTVQGWDEDFSALPGNFTADDFTMRAYDDNTSQACHTSNVSYGTWSFDLHCVSVPNNHFYVAFIAGPAMTPGVNDTIPYEYGLAPVIGQFADLDHAFVFYKRAQGSPFVDIIYVYDVSEVSGWYHIEISRDLDGNFVIAFNGTTRITAVDTEYTTSSVFSFYTKAGPAIDNIVVEPFSTTPTTTDGEPLDLTLILIIGGGIAVVVVVLIVVKMRS